MRTLLGLLFFAALSSAAPIVNATCTVDGATLATGPDPCDLTTATYSVAASATGSLEGAAFALRTISIDGISSPAASAAIADSDTLTLPGEGLATLRLTVLAGSTSFLQSAGSITIAGASRGFVGGILPDHHVFDFTVTRGVAFTLAAEIGGDLAASSAEHGGFYSIDWIGVYNPNGSRVELATTYGSGLAFATRYRPGDDSPGPILGGDPPGVPEPSSALLLASGYAAIAYLVRKLPRKRSA